MSKAEATLVINDSTDEMKDNDDILKQKQNERCMIHIGDDVYVVAKIYNNQLQIHIRQYIRHGGEIYPTKKGVTLSVSRWLLLEEYKAELTQFFDDFFDKKECSTEVHIHLGGGIYVTTNEKYPVLNIRHWWKPETTTDPWPTKKGVILNRNKWMQLTNVMTLIRDYVPELNDAPTGCEQKDHQNQLGMLQCKECNPFEWMTY